MTLKLIAASLLSLGLASGAFAQASGGSGDSGGSGSQGGGTTTGSTTDTGTGHSADTGADHSDNAAGTADCAPDSQAGSGNATVSGTQSGDKPANC